MKNKEIKSPNFKLIKENTVEGCTCSPDAGSRSACGCCGGSCKCAKNHYPHTKKGQSCKIDYIKPRKYEKSHKILSLYLERKLK